MIINVRKTDKTVKDKNAFDISSNVTKQREATTQGWEVYIHWEDKSTTWNTLRDIKYSFPTKLDKYSVENRISSKRALMWRILYTLKKKERFISNPKKRYLDQSSTYGIKLPKSVEETRQIYHANVNTLWMDALAD